MPELKLYRKAASAKCFPGHHLRLNVHVAQLPSLSTTTLPKTRSLRQPPQITDRIRRSGTSVQNCIRLESDLADTSNHRGDEGDCAVSRIFNQNLLSKCWNMTHAPSQGYSSTSLHPCLLDICAALLYHIHGPENPLS